MSRFESNVARAFAARRRAANLKACLDPRRLEALAVNDFVDLMAI